MSVVSEVSSKESVQDVCSSCYVGNKVNVQDFCYGSNVINEINAQDYIEDALQDGYGFWLEGEAKYYFHKWRSLPSDRAGKLHYLKMTQLYLQRLIDDVEKHDVPQCRP